MTEDYASQPTDLRQRISDYLNLARLMQLATSIHDQPWCCTVYFAVDEVLNLYWISKPERRHSKELTVNPKVSAAIVLPQDPGDKVRGLQIEGTAREITDYAEIRDKYHYYSDRFSHAQEEAERIISGENEHHLFQLAPRTIVLFDEVNAPESPRQEYRVSR